MIKQEREKFEEDIESIGKSHKGIYILLFVVVAVGMLVWYLLKQHGDGSTDIKRADQTELQAES